MSLQYKICDGKEMHTPTIEYFDDMIGFRCGHFNIDCKKPVLLLCTGYPDKTGREVIEGDMLSWDTSEWGCEHEDVVSADMNTWNKEDWFSFCTVTGNIHLM